MHSPIYIYIYPKISRYIYVEQIYTQARRLDSYNFLFYNDILFECVDLQIKIPIHSPPSRPPSHGWGPLEVQWGSGVGWVESGWIVNLVSKHHPARLEHLEIINFCCAFKCVFLLFWLHFSIWILVTKKVHQDPCYKSYALESPLQRVRSISFRNPADYKKNLPKNRWLIGADGQNSAEDFRSCEPSSFFSFAGVGFHASTVGFYHQH